jgi:hypothetical protein
MHREEIKPTQPTPKNLTDSNSAYIVTKVQFMLAGLVTTVGTIMPMKMLSPEANLRICNASIQCGEQPCSTCLGCSVCCSPTLQSYWLQAVSCNPQSLRLCSNC